MAMDLNQRRVYSMLDLSLSERKALVLLLDGARALMKSSPTHMTHRNHNERGAYLTMIAALKEVEGL